MAQSLRDLKITLTRQQSKQSKWRPKGRKPFKLDIKNLRPLRRSNRSRALMLEILLLSRSLKLRRGSTMITMTKQMITKIWMEWKMSLMTSIKMSK